MAKRIQVGGRIESKEVGGIVTGAAEILDDAKGKKQSVINGETDDELLRLDQSKQDNLTFDNAPTEGSDNPVKSGGLYTAQQAILLAIAAINELIPSAASALNQLADKAFVNSSISTNTATFRGTSAAGLNEQQFLAWANGLEHDLNDYVFWQTSDAAGNTLFKRYKWNGTEWKYEYTLNNSTFTAEQWEAIQSGITALLVTKLRALPTAEQLIQSFDSKQDVLTFDDVPTLGSTNPVKSSGIFNAIKEVSDALDAFITETEALIPAEATAQNQLADKADVAAKIVAAIPSWKGQYDVLTDLQDVMGAKAGDIGCVKTTDSDGHAVLTFYQYSAQGAWVVYYTLRHYAQNKPATTGTTGDYPYNGMGRIELQKNIVNGVNTLTQAMLTQQNTIYVIQYDFTLGEDITVPENCVLEFDGGSISGAQTLTGNGTYISWNGAVIFGSSINISGTWICPVISTKMFSDLSADNALRKLEALNTDDIQSSMYIEKESYDYYFSLPTNYDVGIHIHSNTDVYINGTIKCKDSAAAYHMIQVSNKKNVTICGSGTIVGDWDVHSGGTVASEWGHCIYIGRCENIKIEGLETTKAWGDGITVSGGSGTPNYRLSVENCSIHHCRRTGIALSNVIGMDISKCHIHHINGTGTGHCINLEIESSDGQDYTIKDIKISNCRLENGGLIGIGSREFSTITNVIVENCILNNNTDAISGYNAITALGNKNILFVNNEITLSNNILVVDETALFKNNTIIPHVNNWHHLGLFEGNNITLEDGIRIAFGTFKNNKIDAYGYGPIRGGGLYDNEITFTSTAANQYCIIPSVGDISLVGNKIKIVVPENTGFYRFILSSTYNILKFDGNEFEVGDDLWIFDSLVSSLVNGVNYCSYELRMMTGQLYLRNGCRLPYGPTTVRPTNVVKDGYQFFDTTEQKVVTKSGTGWVDATGATV